MRVRFVGKLPAPPGRTAKSGYTEHTEAEILEGMRYVCSRFTQMQATGCKHPMKKCMGQNPMKNCMGQNRMKQRMG